MTRIVLVEQFFYPDGWGGAEIPRDITAALSRAGLEVEVLCGTEQYAPMPPGAVGPDPTAQGIKIRRIPRLLPGPVKRLRMVRVAWFCLCALPALLFRRRLGLIIAQTNPPLIVPVVALVALLRRIPFVVIAQDVYPEVLFASRVATAETPPGRALAHLFSWAYRRAHQVVVLGSFMQRRIRAKGVRPERIITISNWATGGMGRCCGRENPLRVTWGLQGRFVVLYSGNIGVGHEFETFLEAVRVAAQQQRELTVLFIGGGSRLAEVRALSQSLGIADRVMFRDFVPAEMLPLSMGVGNLALVTLRAGFEGLIVPSKLLGYMARGIPTLYVGPDSDIADMIRTADCGACCRTGESVAVARVLVEAAVNPEQLSRWSHSGSIFYERHLSRDLAVQQYVTLTRDVLAAVKP